MKMLKTLAVAASMIAATAGTAQAGDYRKCKDTEATIAGGVVGGSIGTIIGEEIAGRGNKTEGAILGGIIGGIAGAAIGDSASSCEKDGRIYDRARDGRYYPRAYPTSRTQSYGYGNTTGYRTASHPARGHAYGHSNRGYDRGYRVDDRQLRRIDRRINDLRRERSQLKERARYEGRRRWIDRRLSEIAYDLDRLKRDRKQIKRGYSYRSNDYRRDNYRGGYTNRVGHYHGPNLCYSNH